MGKVQKCGSWVWYALADDIKNQRITISAILLPRHRLAHGHRQRFLRQSLLATENGAYTLI